MFLIELYLKFVVFFFSFSCFSFLLMFLFQLDVKERKINWPYNVPCMIVDTYICQIQQPENESWQFLVGTNKFGVKYEIGLSLGMAHICWLSGPWKGAAHDDTIASTSKLKDVLNPDEAALANKIYWHDKISFICPLSGHRYTLTDEENSYNYLIYKAQQSVERVIEQLQNMTIFKSIWTKKNLDLHFKCTQITCKLVNLMLMFEPLG